MQNQGLEIYVVYKNPSDFPGLFALRKWSIVAGKMEPCELIATAKEKNEVLKHIPIDRVKIMRSDCDDICIEESWI